MNQGTAVRFATPNDEGRAACHFRHLKGDDTALTLANPLEAYATAPSRLTVNDRDYIGPELPSAVLPNTGFMYLSSEVEFITS